MAKVISSRDKINLSAIGTHTVFSIQTNGRKSQAIRKDTIGTRNPIHLASSKSFKVMLQSRHWTGSRMAPIQYISGANTIFVDDYVDENGVECFGLRSQGYNLEQERETAKTLGIQFTDGLLDIKKYGGDPLLIMFMNAHESNAESPSGKKPDPRTNRLFRFAPLKAEEKAMSRVASFEETFEAMSLLQTLRKKGKKEGEYEYNKDAVNAIVNIFGNKSGFGPDDMHQRFEWLLRISQPNLPAFNSLVKETIQEVNQMLGKAMIYKVVEQTDKTIMCVGAEGKMEILHKFDTKMDEAEKTTFLAYYLLGNPTGIEKYKQIVTYVNEAELKG